MDEAAALTINIDGAARGNPGPAAYAYVMRQQGAVLLEEADCLGTATNNLAEYTALVRALERAAELGAHHLAIRSDSELLVKQMNGLYRVKNPQLKVLYDQASQLCGQFRSVTIGHVPRAENSEADRLCNEALDGRCTRAGAALKRRAPATDNSSLRSEDAVRDEGLAYLRSVVRAWADGDPAAPTAEQVWEHLRTLLLRGHAPTTNEASSD